MAAYTIAIIITFQQPSSPIFLFVISSTFVTFIPIFVIFIMFKKTLIPDIYASEKSTRKKPFIAILFCYSLGILALMLINAPLNLIALLACYLVTSIIMMIISHFWKISIHASGISGPATFLTHQLGFGMIPFVLLILPISWARLKLKAHDIYQVAAGSVLAIVLTYVQLEIYLTG